MGKGKIPRASGLDCRFDDYVVAALAQGFGRELVVNGIESWERADDIRRGIYRCARHRKVSAEAGPARAVTGRDDMGIRKTGKTYSLSYRLWDKRTGRARHLERYGADRAGWPYDPRRRATDEEKSSWAPRTERGRPVTTERER